MGAGGADGGVGPAPEVWEGHASEKKSDRSCRTRWNQSSFGGEFLGLVEGLRKREEHIRRGKDGRSWSR